MDKLKLSVHSLKIRLSQFLPFPSLFLRLRLEGILKRPFGAEEFGARSFAHKAVVVEGTDAWAMPGGASLGRVGGGLRRQFQRNHSCGFLILYAGCLGLFNGFVGAARPGRLRVDWSGQRERSIIRW